VSLAVPLVDVIDRSAFEGASDDLTGAGIKGGKQVLGSAPPVLVFHPIGDIIRLGRPRRMRSRTRLERGICPLICERLYLAHSTGIYIDMY